MSKVYVICTGGTLGMTSSKDGLRLMASGHIEEKIRALPIMHHPSMPVLVFKEFPLIDSSQMSLEYWNSLAREIYKYYEEYDGFVILHGTDTMAYTGAALSFMLQELSKPIILTGAQTPFDEVVSDARENIINAIFIAGNTHWINEVCIYFNQLLLRANRTTKISTTRYKAYSSLSYPPLGSVGSKVEIHPDSTSVLEVGRKLILTEFRPVDIRSIRITPYLTASALAKVLDGAQAVILETYGDGNMQSNESFLKLLSEADEKGVILVNRSQCPDSKTSSDLYVAGSALETSCGVISAGDQTIEAIMAKLTYLFNMGLKPSSIKEYIGRNFSGEYTPPSVTHAPKVSFFPERTTHEAVLGKKEKEAEAEGFMLRARL